MESLDDNNICRLCLSVSPENMENLFTNNEIWTKISQTLTVKLQQEANLPNGICYACTAITHHIHSFHQKVIQSQNILNKKLNEGTDRLLEFLNTLKNLKIENSENSNVNIPESFKIDENDDNFTNEKSVAEVSNNTTTNKLTKKTVKSKTNDGDPKLELKKRRIEPTELEIIKEDLSFVKIEQDTMDVSVENRNKEESDYDLAQESASEDIDWKPQTKKRKVKKQKKCKDYEYKDDIIPETDTQNNFSNTKEVEENVTDQDYNSATTDAMSTITLSNIEGQITEQSSYKCLTCFESYSHRKLLVQHFYNKHKPDIVVTPDICLKNYTKFEEGNNRIRKSKCGYCGKVAKTKNIKEHILSAHNKVRPYVCNICGKTFKRISEIITHNRAHNGLSLFCSYNCGFNSAYIHAVKKHEMTKHRKQFRYKCECGKGFDAKTWYEDHQNEHKGVKPYVCPICQQAYYYKKQLKAHRRSVHLKSDKEALEEIRLLCTICSHPCDDMPALKDHLFKIHGIQKKYLCDTCGRSFNTSANLHCHRRSKHSDDRPHACRFSSECNKSFKTKSKLKRHLMSHNNERPHACAHCGKRYARPQGLKQHLLTCPTIKKEDQKETTEAS